MADDKPLCELCGEPMPPGESIFKFHGYSGPCPKPPKPRQHAEAEPGDARDIRAELFGWLMESFDDDQLSEADAKEIAAKAHELYTGAAQADER